MKHKRILGYTIILGVLAFEFAWIANKSGFVALLSVIATAVGLTFLIVFTAWLLISE